jgi:hypothetical protein
MYIYKYVFLSIFNNKMAQAMIDMKKLKNRKNVSTQTGFTSEFCIYLSNTKKARLYFSESYKDLVLYVHNARPDTDGVTNLTLRFNSDSTTNYVHSGGNQIYRASFNRTNIIIGVEAPSSASTALTHILIPQYANTTTWKIIWGKGMTNSYYSGNVTMENHMGVWGGTSAINSITLLPDGASFTSGTAYVYGVN